uniref:Uncharacterized protein n=1 Tax=uncultured Desulfobacterium sp. TaxID=201089 RepID=E1YM34_9BACT|nr:unknown protein [uncultured Desulfobacterium sp.]
MANKSEKSYKSLKLKAPDAAYLKHMDFLFLGMVDFFNMNP